MAREDPSLVQLYNEFQDPERTTAFLRHFNLLPPAAAPIGLNRKGNPYLAMCADKPFNPVKPNCPGKITETWIGGNRYYRCTVCKSNKSIHNGSSAYNPVVLPTGLPVFNTRDATGRPNRKMDPKDILYILFCLAKGLQVSSLHALIGRKFGKETAVEWSQQIRELTIQELAGAPKMGGPNDIVEIDECYMKGRRKANRGRYLQGNRYGQQGHMRNNYLRRSQGPWLFGMIVRRTRECRMFWVADRSAATLIPIIKANVAPGTTIYSDEWRAYRQIVHHGFPHLAVNHSLHFVDPVTGCSTQIIERQWRKIKLPLLKQGPGVRERTLPSHLAMHWWMSLNGRHVCSDPFYRLVELVSNYCEL